MLSWTVYNLVALLLAMLVCIERPRDGSRQRLPTESAELVVAGRRYAAWVSDLGLDEARVRGPHGLTVGAPVALELADVGTIPCTLAIETADGYRVRLQPDAEQRHLLIRKLHTGAASAGATRGDLIAMTKQLARALHLR